MKDNEYLSQLKARMKDRVEFIKGLDTAKQGYDKLPKEALEAIEKVFNECK